MNNDDSDRSDGMQQPQLRQQQRSGDNFGGNDERSMSHDHHSHDGGGGGDEAHENLGPSSCGGTGGTSFLVPVTRMRWTDSDGDSGYYSGHVNSSSIPHGPGTMEYDDGPVVEGQWIEGEIEDYDDSNNENNAGDSNCSNIEEEEEEEDAEDGHWASGDGSEMNRIKLQRKRRGEDRLSTIIERSGTSSHLNASVVQPKAGNSNNNNSSSGVNVNRGDPPEGPGEFDDENHEDEEGKAGFDTVAVEEDGDADKKDRGYDTIAIRSGHTENNSDHGGSEEDNYEDNNNNRGSDMAVRKKNPFLQENNDSDNEEATNDQDRDTSRDRATDVATSDRSGTLDGIDKEFIETVEQVSQRFHRSSALGMAGEDHAEEGEDGDSEGKVVQRGGAWTTQQEVSQSPFIIEPDEENAPVIHKSKKLKSSGIGQRRRCRSKFCIFFVIVTILCLGAAGAVCWYIFGYLKNNDNAQPSQQEQGVTVNDDTHGTQPNAASSDDEPYSLPWEEDAPCADFLIEVRTDKYGNETMWELFYQEGTSVEGELLMSERDSLIAQVDRKRLRPHQHSSSWSISSNTRRRRLENTNNLQMGSLVLRSGPFPYLDKDDPTYIPEHSGQYTSRICLPLGQYQFVIHDLNGDGLCCSHGLGAYQLSFYNGREVNKGDGMFTEKEETDFEVVQEDIEVGLVTESPSGSVMPTGMPSAAPTKEQRVIPTGAQYITTISESSKIGTTASHGLLFDIRVHSNISSIAIVGMDLLIEAVYTVEYEIWTRSGSWQDADDYGLMSGMNGTAIYKYNPTPGDDNHLEGYTRVSNGTIDGIGTSDVSTIAFDDFYPVIIRGGATQAFWITLKEDSLLLQSYVSSEGTEAPTQVATPEFEVLYGTAVLVYPLSKELVQGTTGFLGNIWYSGTDEDYVGNVSADSILGGSTNTNSSLTEASENATETFSPNYQPSFPDNTTVLTSNATTHSNTTTPSPTPASSSNDTTLLEISMNNTINFTTPLFNNSYDTDSDSNATNYEYATTTSSPSISPPSGLYTTITPTVWNPVLTYSNSLVVEGIHGSSQFGFAMDVSEDGSLMAVGAKDAPNEAGDATTGAVYLYSLDEFTGGFDSTSPPEPFEVIYGDADGSEFGCAIALSNDGRHLVVGSRSENEQTGASRIYEIIDGIATLKALFPGQSPEERSGWSVAISGDGSVVAVGATKGGSNEGGIITLYEYKDPDSWTASFAIEAGAGDVAGYSLALSYTGTVMAVGSVKFASKSSLRNAGLVTVYAFDGSNWKKREDIIGEAKLLLEGSSVGLSKDGSVLVSGATGYITGSKQLAGRCKIFAWNETRYDLLYTMEGQTKKEELGSSAAVSDDGNMVACGGTTGRWGENIASVSGVVRLWKRSANREKTIWPEGNSHQVVDDGSFGSALSISGKLLFVGASTWSGVDRNGPGAVHIFDTNW